MRIGYLLHSLVPGPTTNTEQAVNALAALAGQDGLAVDLCVPSSPGPRADGHSREKAIERHYGLPGGTFGPALRLREMPLPAWATGRLRGLLFDLHAAPWARLEHYDALYARDPVTLVGALTTGLPVIFETYRTDINRSRRWWPFRRMAYGADNLAGIIVHSRVARQAFLDAGVDAAHVLLAYNSFTRPSDGPTPSRPAAREALRLSADRPIVCYAGGVGPHKGTDVLASLARLVPEALFMIVGAAPGAVPPPAESSENLLWLPRVAPAALAAYLAAADVLILPPTARHLVASGRTVLPIKIFAYLAAGRPIIAPDLPDIGEVLSMDNAVIVPPDDLPTAAAALRRVLADPHLAERLSAAALQTADTFTWQARASLVAAFLRQRLSA